MLTVKEVYKLAASGLSMKEIREIEFRRADYNFLCLTPRDVRFLTCCGVRVEPQDLSKRRDEERKRKRR